MPLEQPSVAGNSPPPTRSPAGSPEGGSAIALLRFDHERIGFLFSDYQQAASLDDKRSIVVKIADEWRLHTQLEHEIFYPAAKEALQAFELVPDFASEHIAIDALLEALVDAQPGGEAYEATVRTLGRFIAKHAKDEQGQLFQRAKASGMDLGALGRRLKQRKQELLAERAAGVLVAPA